MEIVERKEVIENVVREYVACDGKKFDSEVACLAHETDIKQGELERKVNALEVGDLHGYIPTEGDCYYYDENAYRWYKPRNKEDIKLLNEYYNSGKFFDNCNNTQLTSDCINAWVCYEVNDCGAYFYYRVYKDIDNKDCPINKYITDLLSKLGYNVSITKKTD